MTTATKILTQHPQGKSGVNIGKEKYDLIRSQIAACLERDEELTLTQLTEAGGTAVEGRFEGSINWYTEVVKLDLEARRAIERLAGSNPQRYRLVEA